MNFQEMIEHFMGMAKDAAQEDLLERLERDNAEEVLTGMQIYIVIKCSAMQQYNKIFPYNCQPSRRIVPMR